MSGAQVLPIFAYTNDKTYFDKLFPKLNGVLFPGGSIHISIDNIWTQNADYILKYAINQNKKGNVFPVWGTCLGWELIAYLTSGYDRSILSPVRGEDSIINTVSIRTPSYLFDDLSANLKNKLQNGQGLLYYHHSYAVLATTYQNNERLRSFWNIASTTTSSFN
jgi:gamma-glutamyl hydrolase